MPRSACGAVPSPAAATSSLTEYQTIARGRFRPQQRETGKRLRTNDQIRISPVRLIDDDNNQVGVVPTDQARDMAREAGLDLVEVSPNSEPPVCRIMDYGKWKYAQQKKESKAKAHAKKSELKGIRLRPKIDDHDRDMKVRKARKFLEDGDKVQFTMLFRGREMAHQDIGRDHMQQIVETLADCAKVEQPARMMGRRMTMLMTPDKNAKARTDASNADAGGKSEAKNTPADTAAPSQQ